MFSEILNAPFLNWNEVPTTTLIYFIILILLYIKHKRQNDSKAASFAKQLQQNNIKPMPTPPKMPIIGHIHLLRDHQHNPWEGFNVIRKQFGDIVSLKMGIHPMALVSSSSAMREILLKKGNIFSDRPNFARHHIIFGGDKENSLALCDWSDTHRDRRKFCKRGIVPSRFSSRNQLLESIISRLVVRYVNQLNHRQGELDFKLSQERILSNGNKQQMTDDSYYYITNKEDILYLTSDIFMDFLCGEKYSHDDPEYKDFVHGCDFVFWDINQSYLIDFLPALTSLGLGFTYLKKLKRVTDFLRDYIDDKIFDPRRMRHIKQNENESSSSTNDAKQSSASTGEDYLDSIISEHLANVTSMSLADYKVGFADLLAGHAAVANILIRVLGHLALDQQIQDLICEEAIKADIDNLDYKPSLPVAEAAMQEALRIASSPIVPHVAREDTSIDEFFVPKGTMILFNNYHLNLSENLWSNPKEFDPTRFLETNLNASGEEEYKLNIPKHFMPFSVGMRQCLGYKMVETTTVVTIANLCRKFILRPNNEQLVRKLLTPKGSVALNPDAECFELKLYPR